jgi:hypothetical protein
MQNNTFEDYKKAIKNKYEVEKGSEYFVYLNNPTRAKLRNLCWELFQQQNRNQDDLNVFSSLLGLPFDINRRNKFDEQIDKFRPIENYFKGETDPANVDAVNMAAILVDFKARPFNKFRIQSLYQDETQNDDANIPEIENPEKETIDGALILEKFLAEKEKEKGIEKGNDEKKETGKVIEAIQAKPNSFFAVKKKGFPQIEIKKKHTLIVASLFLFIGFVVIFFVFPNKECMQWSGDHYELVDCDLKIESTGDFTNIEILDPTLVNLKKIKICDTTTCFDKNGTAIIWYAKTANGIDFFNAHGRHPENNNSLRPVTHYILNKYVKNKQMPN